MLNLMIKKLNERHQAISEALSSKIPSSQTVERKVTDEQLFNQLGKKMKRVKKS